MQAIVIQFDRGVKTPPEGGEAALVNVLVVEHKQPLSANCATVKTYLLGVPVGPSEGALGPFVLGDVVLEGSETFFQEFRATLLLQSQPLFIKLVVLKRAASGAFLGEEVLVGHNATLLVDLHIDKLLKVCHFRHDGP